MQMNFKQMKYSWDSFWWKITKRLKSYHFNAILVGDIYESCDYIPVMATEVDYVDDNIMGISLIDGSNGHGCSLYYCGVVKMTMEEALERKENWKYKDDVNHSYWKKIYGEWEK